MLRNIEFPGGQGSNDRVKRIIVLLTNRPSTIRCACQSFLDINHRKNSQRPITDIHTCGRRYRGANPFLTSRMRKNYITIIALVVDIANIVIAGRRDRWMGSDLVDLVIV